MTENGQLVSFRYKKGKSFIKLNLLFCVSQTRNASKIQLLNVHCTAAVHIIDIYKKKKGKQGHLLELAYICWN